MAMRRLILGLLAVVAFIAGAALYLSDLPKFWSESFAYMALRVGILLGVLWLALPQIADLLRRVSPVTLACLGISGLMLLIQPKLIRYVGPLLLAIIAFQFLTGKLGKPREARNRVRRR